MLRGLPKMIDDRWVIDCGGKRLLVPLDEDNEIPSEVKLRHEQDHLLLGINNRSATEPTKNGSG